MAETFTIKPISEEAVPQALKKAELYRLLNEPVQAESICRDILRVHPDDQQVLVMVILALSDQFLDHHGAPPVRAAKEFVERLTDEYQLAYYSGLIAERQGRALMAKGMPGAFAYDTFREAMHYYEKAEAIRPSGNDEAILRWNSCVRTIRQANLERREEPMELPLE
jgi:hypothetical protein